MRIAVSGTTRIGKSSYIQDFLDVWTKYESPDKTYRDIVKENDNFRFGGTTQKKQKKILDFMVEQHKDYRSYNKVIFDRCPLDNLAYSLWCHERAKVDDDFINECIPIIRESLRKLDIIFFMPLTKAAPVEFEGTEEQAQFREEIDNIYKGIYYQWMNNPKCTLFHKDDKPAIIEMYGTPHQRMALTQMYLNADGDPIDATPTLEQLKEMGDMNQLIEDQKDLVSRRK